MTVPLEYIERAWDMIRPQLTFVAELTEYVGIDAPVARFRGYMERKDDWVQHSEAMRGTSLSSSKMRLAVETLEQSGFLEVRRDQKVDAHNRPYVVVWYRRKGVSPEGAEG